MLERGVLRGIVIGWVGVEVIEGSEGGRGGAIYAIRMGKNRLSRNYSWRKIFVLGKPGQLFLSAACCGPRLRPDYKTRLRLITTATDK